jgi:hypothetical protein
LRPRRRRAFLVGGGQRGQAHCRRFDRQAQGIDFLRLVRRHRPHEIAAVGVGDEQVLLFQPGQRLAQGILLTPNSAASASCRIGWSSANWPETIFSLRISNICSDRVRTTRLIPDHSTAASGGIVRPGLADLYGRGKIRNGRAP